MKKELELKLVENYPNLFQDYGGDMTKTCMHWGFEHGDGWYDLVNELSSKLEPHGIIATQVKEKFGGLRFYIRYPDHLSDKEVAKIRDIKNEYESKSYETCESCAKPGELRVHGWRRTLCDGCEEEFYGSDSQT
jgi:hypothetical protein